MELPDLPPDIAFPRLRHDADDVAFAFQAKRAALGPHIVERWPWDEPFQRALHLRRYGEKPFFAIRREGRRLGTVSIAVSPTCVRFGEFYLLPEFQRPGIGSRVLRHCLDLTDGLGLPVRLEYLHWNPVGSLYRRWGFVEMGRTDIHRLMERPPCPR